MTKRRRRSKKRDEERDNHSDLFSILPLDVIVEIFLKLPAKSIARLNFVSKHLLSIIRNKDFIKLYMNRNLTRPRLLFVYVEKHSKSSMFLRSSSHEDISSDHLKVSVTFNPDFSALVHGLICHHNGTKVMIGNPSTGQFITLPRVQTLGRYIYIYSFLGYDPVNDLYKVLRITVLQIRGYRALEHQIFTLGPKQKWRKITCKHPYLPGHYHKSICIDGVVYYYGWIKSKGFLICFDVTSEDFSVIELPQAFPFLVNYCGKIALYRMGSEGTVNFWVLQDAVKQEWSKVSYLIPSWTDLVEHTTIMGFKGTLSTGQLIFAPLCHKSIYSTYFLISYDPKENTTKKVVIAGTGESRPIQLYMDHVESPMVLSNIS